MQIRQVLNSDSVLKLSSIFSRKMKTVIRPKSLMMKQAILISHPLIAARIFVVRLLLPLREWDLLRSVHIMKEDLDRMRLISISEIL